MGYCVCWAQSREESADKLVVWSAAAVYAAGTRTLRRLRHVLPDAAEWPKAELEKVERAELKLLCAFAERCREQGLDSPILNQLVLAVLCAHAQGDPHGPAVQGLLSAASPSGSSARSPPVELAFRIQEATAASEGEVPPVQLLPNLTAALVSLLPVLGSREQLQELGYSGLSYLGKSAAVATGWVASSETARQLLGRRVHTFTEEEESQVTQDLCSIWKALRRSSAGLGLRDRWYLRRQLEEAKDRLPKSMRGAVEDASVAFELGSSRGKAGKLFDSVAWSALFIFLLAVVSDDGIGLLRFHVVPESFQQVVKERLQERALRVEELLTRHDPPAQDETAIAYIEPPPGNWDVPEYLQGPLFRGNPS